MRLRPFYLLTALLLAGLALRLFYYAGHVFSDDAYYSYLGYTLYQGAFGHDYLGYPIMLLRFGMALVTATSFGMFGVSAASTSMFPMLVSLANLVLVYFWVREFNAKIETAALAMFLMAFFPTDIIFSGLLFSDAIAAFFINLGLYFLYRANRCQKISEAVIGAALLAVSMQFKMSVLFSAFLLAVLFSWNLLRGKALNRILLVTGMILLLAILLEGLIYFYLNGHFFYRFRLLEANYSYAFNDFFGPGSSFGFSDSKDYWPALLKTVFIYNPKALFLRRFMLFIPLLATVQAVILWRKKEHRVLVFYYLGLTLLYLFFSTSLHSYRPLVLRFSWYVYPLFVPAVILTAMLITSLKKKFIYAFLILYLAGGIWVMQLYEDYFNIPENRALTEYMHTHAQQTLYTDHFSKYSIDLIDGYATPSRTRRIVGRSFSWLEVKEGDLVLYNPNHIQELKLQGHRFPTFEILESGRFKEVNRFGQFVLYQCCLTPANQR